MGIKTVTMIIANREVTIGGTWEVVRAKSGNIERKIGGEDGAVVIANNDDDYWRENRRCFRQWKKCQQLCQEMQAKGKRGAGGLWPRAIETGELLLSCHCPEFAIVHGVRQQISQFPEMVIRNKRIGGFEEPVLSGIRGKHLA